MDHDSASNTSPGESPELPQTGSHAERSEAMTDTTFDERETMRLFWNSISGASGVLSGLLLLLSWHSGLGLGTRFRFEVEDARLRWFRAYVVPFWAKAFLASRAW